MLCFASSIGDWFLLYQMNKSMNQRFFAEFLALLSIKVQMLIYAVSDWTYFRSTRTQTLKIIQK
jgi:hypothetical protein